MSEEPSDEAFLASFEAMEIPGSAFGHRQHIRLAWLYLREASLAEGAARFCAQFGKFVRHVGAEGKYHETITWFFLALVHERIHRGCSCLSWNEFAEANADLLQGSASLMGGRYSPQALQDPVSRRVFILPDLAPQRP